MNERPILFSAPMVRAILAGTKTQTRRAVKSNIAIAAVGSSEDWNRQKAHPAMGTPRLVLLDDDGMAFSLRCPYGQPGDRLWVRESGAKMALRCPEDPEQPFIFRHDEPATRSMGHYWVQRTRAPGASYSTECTRAEFLRNPSAKAVPSIHMPRWACRITLEITSVRVERLQDISEADALAEGIVQLKDGGYGLPAGEHYHSADPRKSYFSLWEAINGPGSVEANPWVWVVGFERMAA